MSEFARSLRFICLLPLLLHGVALCLSGCPEEPGGGEGEGEGEGEDEGEGIAAMEIDAFDLINDERATEGVDPLVMDADLRAVARAHSEDMVERDFFAHNNPDGESPFDRIRAAGLDYSAAAENIAWNSFSDPVATAVDGWMDSPGHRTNILNPVYTHTGMGVADNGEGGFYFTQVFTLPLKKGWIKVVVREFEVLPPPLAVYP